MSEVLKEINKPQTQVIVVACLLVFLSIRAHFPRNQPGITVFVLALALIMMYRVYKHLNDTPVAPLCAVHPLLRLLLNRLNTICEKHQIQYWADSGTLLGAVREGGIIPHDDDVDICMTKHQIDRLMSVIDTTKDSEVKLYKANFPVYKFEFVGIDRAWIDIFEVEDQDNVFRYKERECQEVWPNFWNNKIDLFPLQRAKLDSEYVWIPKNPIPYLERCYGKDWQTPVKYDRHT